MFIAIFLEATMLTEHISNKNPIVPFAGKLTNCRHFPHHIHITFRVIVKIAVPICWLF